MNQLHVAVGAVTVAAHNGGWVGDTKIDNEKRMDRANEAVRTVEPGRFRTEGNATGTGVIDTTGARAPTPRTKQRPVCGVCAVEQTVGRYMGSNMYVTSDQTKVSASLP